jgi:hypothetical protein
VSLSARAHNDARLALATLQLDGVITGWATNFTEYQAPGWAPQVHVTIAAADELALERTKRQVGRALEPHVRGVEIIVTPGVLPSGEGDRFQFGNEETE